MLSARSKTIKSTQIGPNDCEWLATPFSNESESDEKTNSSGVRYPIDGIKLNNMEPNTKNIATERHISRTSFEVTFLSLTTSIVTETNANITEDQSMSFMYEMAGLNPNSEEKEMKRIYGNIMKTGLIRLFFRFPKILKKRTNAAKRSRIF